MNALFNNPAVRFDTYVHHQADIHRHKSNYSVHACLYVQRPYYARSISVGLTACDILL